MWQLLGFHTQQMMTTRTQTYRVCKKRLLSEMEDLLAACENESI